MPDTLSVYLTEDDAGLSARIERRLSYGESKSRWAATAIKDRLTIESAAQSAGVALPDDRRARDAMLRDAISQLDADDAAVEDGPGARP